MRLAQGPRPLAIRLFAVLLGASALAGFAHEITHLAAIEAWLAGHTPLLASRDAAIVAVFTRLTVALVPVALIWFLASGIARWFILFFALGKLTDAPRLLAGLEAGPAPAPLLLLALGCSLAGVALLFTPPAARWLASKGARHGPVFD